MSLIHLILILTLIHLITKKLYSVCDYEKDIDPDNNLYNDILMSCKYYTEQQLNSNIQLSKAMGISIIHFNARSLNKNFRK